VNIESVLVRVLERWERSDVMGIEVRAPELILIRTKEELHNGQEMYDCRSLSGCRCPGGIQYF
jgi:hypothetical protein